MRNVGFGDVDLQKITKLELGENGIWTQICLTTEYMCLITMGPALPSHLVTTSAAPFPRYPYSTFVSYTSFLLLFFQSYSIFFN